MVDYLDLTDFQASKTSLCHDPFRIARSVEKSSLYLWIQRTDSTENEQESTLARSIPVALIPGSRSSLVNHVTDGSYNRRR
ncbi:hypothetical protein DPMN_162868 [Dreissena polymorpha]|uniref:Uncharacterized protein n=1 Tax=Dreissena polymorpha TaxID=45954 RepID=A0A9D4ER31_DREPO|nr:hypothetical protein DPMN_162868 [Dreissena polymorpha]